MTWSLEEFFAKQLNRKRGARLESEEVVECPFGALVKLTVCHRTIDGSSSVWSEGIMKVIEPTEISNDRMRFEVTKKPLSTKLKGA